MNMNPYHSGDFIIIRAQEDGVNVIGLTRGKDTRFHHSEKLDKGEVMIAQFTEHTYQSETGRADQNGPR